MTACRVAGSRVAGCRVAGSRVPGSRVAGCRVAGCRGVACRVAGCRVAACRVAGWPRKKYNFRWAPFLSGKLPVWLESPWDIVYPTLDIQYPRFLPSPLIGNQLKP